LERYLVDQGCVPPLCDLLTVMDTKIIRVALNGLENILKIGDMDAKQSGETNKYALLIEESYGELNLVYPSTPFNVSCSSFLSQHELSLLRSG
jgi:hypothetical protein